jgi:hypothetical protein
MRIRHKAAFQVEKGAFQVSDLALGRFRALKGRPSKAYVTVEEKYTQAGGAGKV